MTSLINTVLLLGITLLYLKNFTTAATITSTKESPKKSIFDTNLFPLTIEGNTTDSPVTNAPVQEFPKHNISATDIFSLIVREKPTDPSQNSLKHGQSTVIIENKSVENFTTTAPIEESLSNNISTTDLFSLIIGDKFLDSSTTTYSQESSKHKQSAVTIEDKLSENMENTPITLEPASESENDNLFELFSLIFENNPKEDIVLATTTTTMAPSQELSHNHNLFAADLFSALVKGKSAENIVYSPASIQTCMALAFIGAEGETAKELREVLRLGEGDKLQVAKEFREFLKTALKAESVVEERPELQIANRLYVNEQLKVDKEFQKMAQEYFHTQAEAINFSDNTKAVEKINQWIEQHTENKIKDVLDTNAVNQDTNAVIVNAIYYKAKWLNPFSVSSTSTSIFHVNLNDSMEAEMMYNEDYYRYADLPELKASALEMPYENSDISMLFILPNDIEGLEDLELKLRGMDLNEITAKMSFRKVDVYVPKFRIEFDINLKEPLEKMGLTTTFTPDANFKGIFSTSQFQGISEVKHKAFLDVNEAGSEAAAATFATLTTLSAVFDEPTFHADHPFIFAIRSKSVVYFAGHVAKM
ncbi:serine protease inhibitor 42Dd-like [Lucilia cuprina]|uniref:serine protease inhibitor 42Dd-like n=1 Tax=Lucilia cuprina TaxID=7375 RepID=UPI001F05A83A|nr:serine protease inhibitor 42Dd-like [Lucilia cuprina]